jgi:hypothetical protein
MSTDLLTWKNNISNIITMWRRDPTAMFPVPFPVQTSQIRGDAQALSLHNDLQFSRQDIAGGMDVPADFLYGNLTWSGGNVSLRVLENLFINRVGGLDRLLTWINGHIGPYLTLPECQVRHKDFKMADDVAQKNIALSLRASGTISDQTVLEELDFDYYGEKKKRAEELKDRMIEMESQAVNQAEIDAKVAMIRAKSDLEIQQMQQEWLAAQQPPAPAPGSPEAVQQDLLGAGPSPQDMGGPPMQQGPPQGATEPMTQARVNGAPNQMMLDMQANNIIKTTPPDQMDFRIAQLRQQDPMLSSMLKQKLGNMKKFQTSAQPLPEQKPPRAGPENAQI